MHGSWQSTDGVWQSGKGECWTTVGTKVFEAGVFWLREHPAVCILCCRPFLTDNGQGMVWRQFGPGRLIGGNYFPVPSALYWMGPKSDGKALQVLTSVYFIKS